MLLVHALGSSRTDLYAHSERLIDPQQRAIYQALVDRRASGVPLPYLTGQIEFYGLNLTVDRRSLIPRPETETLVDLALAVISDKAFAAARSGSPVIVDVGTGSGCIVVAVAIHAPHARFYALDLSLDALVVAKANAQRHQVADRISFLESDLLAALPEPADLIVANPPYIAQKEWDTLPIEVREHEPRLALHGGADGLDTIRRLLSQVPTQLHPGGGVLIEIGAAQAEDATHLARIAFPKATVTVHTDLAGRDRVLSIMTRQEFIDHTRGRSQND